ncbi:hypothetical protein CQW49_11500 [Methylosinus trichosporium OB3b]|uniref:Uncharacterized protein n=1 Tax=Methylosinus trichosporium (strain ATCC 35070 / NCIMB 11131 / UNIQEM 75 / OB3b) TaxID=595536 RepID=A0A2D2D0P2_METT3|nr:hypothetical protein [Methylosinus trichosporium]ATQ68439.1 hypothetical protein CQW49_11500 [Methylosinus trichosporium OB3b]OBS51324.1 hypothetical protein A8B73_16710 [Methylosinus sp. 3S-1]
MGAGVEWALSPDWSVESDHLRYDLGPNRLFQHAMTASARFDGNLIHAGANRHFDLFAPAPVSEERRRGQAEAAALVRRRAPPWRRVSPEPR